MENDNLYSTLRDIYDKLNEVRCEVAGLKALAEEMRADVRSLSDIPTRVECVDTRLAAAEHSMEKIHAKTWAVTTMVIATVLTSVGSLVVSFMVGR